MSLLSKLFSWTAKKQRLRAPDDWILGPFVVFLGAAEQFPRVLDRMQISCLSWLPCFEVPANTWDTLWTWCLFFLCFLVFLWRFRDVEDTPLQDSPLTDSHEEPLKVATPVPDWESPEFRKKVLRHLFWIGVIRGVRSLGLVWFREWILGMLGVTLYDTFRRPKNWVAEPDRSYILDRISFEGPPYRSIEVQYARDYSDMFIRSTSEGSNNAYDTDVKALQGKEAWALFFASNYYWYWKVRHYLKGLFK